MTNNERICWRIQQGHIIANKLVHLISEAKQEDVTEDNILYYYGLAEELRDVLSTKKLAELYELFKLYESLE